MPLRLRGKRLGCHEVPRDLLVRSRVLCLRDLRLLLRDQKATLGTDKRQRQEKAALEARAVAGWCLYVAKGTFRRPEAGESGAGFLWVQEAT